MPFHAQKPSRESLKPGLSVPASVAALPKTHSELDALLQGERIRAETQAAIEVDIAAQVEAGISLRIEAEVAHRVELEVARLVSAEVDRRVAIEVAVQVQKLLEEIRLARHKMFAASSEAHLGQGSLFNEIVALIDARADEPDDDQDEDQPRTASRPVARGKRRPLPPELPRVELVIDVPPAQRLCACGKHMVKIGEEVSEQLNIIPMRIEVLRTVRPRYACPAGDSAPIVAPVANGTAAQQL